MIMRKTTLPDVSVIVLAYRQRRSLKLLLRHIQTQKTKLRIQTIVTDDGTPLGQKDMSISDVLERVSIVDHYVWQRRAGFRAASARNNAIRLARGTVLIFLDGDMIPAEDLVERHYETARIGKVISVGFRERRTLSANDSDDVSFNELMDRDVPDESKARQINELNFLMEARASATPWRCPIGGNVAISRCDEVVFDERFCGWGLEDWDLSLRLVRNHSFRIEFDPLLKCIHDEEFSESHNPFITRNESDIEAFCLNAFYFLEKHDRDKLACNEVFNILNRFRVSALTGKIDILPRDASRTPVDARHIEQLKATLHISGSA